MPDTSECDPPLAPVDDTGPEPVPRADAAIPPLCLRTERLLLRCWRSDDAPLFKAALDSSLPELQKWIPWTLDEPSELSELEERLGRYRADFAAGGDALYAVMDPEESEVLGGAGLYRRVGPGAVEIGYWTRSDLAGRGIATEAAAALTGEARTLVDVTRVEIHCDPANLASTAIPRRLGYTRGRTFQAERPSPATGSRELVIWTLDA